MKKIIGIIAAVVLFGGFIGIVIAGFYPVALVNGSPVYYAQWKADQDVMVRMLNAQAVTLGDKPVDLTVGRGEQVAHDIKRDALQLLIDDKIITQQGRERDKNFNARAEAKLAAELQKTKGTNLDTVANTLYGITGDRFKQTVLLPQARREVLAEIEVKDPTKFDLWFSEFKRAKKVRLILVPYTWNGTELK